MKASVFSPLKIATLWAPGAAMTAIVTWYFFFLWQHSFNVPLADDIHDVLEMMSLALSAEGASQAFDVAFAQHNEHRTFATRLFYFIQYFLLGEIDFGQLILIANLSLVCLLALLYLMIEKPQNKALLLLPCALMLFQLRTYGLMFWSMAAFAFFFVYLYGFLTIALLHKLTRFRFVLATVTASLGSLTLASGQLIWLLGAACIFQQSVLRKNSQPLYLIAWLISAIVALSCWRIGFDSRYSLVDMLQIIADQASQLILYTLALLGSIATDTNVALAATLGALMVTVCSLALIRDFRHKDMRLLMCCWFIILSAFTMALGRWFANIDTALATRYSFPSVLLAICCWLLLASRWKLPRIIPACAIALALTFYAHSWTYYAAPLQKQLLKRVTAYNNYNYPAWPFPMRESNAKVAKAIDLGIYHPPPRPLAAPKVMVKPE